MDPIAYLQTFYKNNVEKVKRMQALIRSRVFELHYAKDGPYEVPPLASDADNVRGGEFQRMIDKIKDSNKKASYFNSRGNISLESIEYNKVVYPSHTYVSASSNTNTTPLDNEPKNDVSPPNNWPLCGTGTDINDLKPCRDAYDIIVDYSLGFHSKTVRDERVGHIPYCWKKGRLSADKMHCLPPL